MKKIIKALVASTAIILASCHGVPAYAQGLPAPVCTELTKVIGVYHEALQNGTVTAEQLYRRIDNSEVFSGKEMEGIRGILKSGVYYSNVHKKTPNRVVKENVNKICLTGNV